MLYDELQGIAFELQEKSLQLENEGQKTALDNLEKAVYEVGKSWSGSFIGYHANVYYKDFICPPAKAHFSVEWGLDHSSHIQGTVGDWQRYTSEDIENEILNRENIIDLTNLMMISKKTSDFFEDKKTEILSIISTYLTPKDDKFLNSLQKQIEDLIIDNEKKILQPMLPTTQFQTRDSEAAMQGSKIPKHLEILAKILSINLPFERCKNLSSLANKASNHIKRIEFSHFSHNSIGTNVFIGHGQSSVWRDLKDFLQDRLNLPWDEFNRMPVAGITNINRLSQMLDSAAIAFLVMTGEDAQKNGELHARMNVIHEAGLFQGRLGFTKAIILLEEGCEEFSNIQGLGQIRFPKDNIKAAFEEIREVLEREEIIQSSS